MWLQPCKNDFPGPLAAVRSQWTIMLRKHLILALSEETNEIEDFWTFWSDVLLVTQYPFHVNKWYVDQVEELGGSGVGEHSRLVSFDVNLHYSSSTTHQRQKIIKQNGACTRPTSTVCRVH